MFFSSNSSITLFKNWIFLLLESIISSFKLGKNIFRTIPGNPAPLPTSNKWSTLFKSIIFTIVNES